MTLPLETFHRPIFIQPTAKKEYQVMWNIRLNLSFYLYLLSCSPNFCCALNEGQFLVNYENKEKTKTKVKYGDSQFSCTLT